MTEFITVRVSGNYVPEKDGDTVKVRFENGDSIRVPNRAFKRKKVNIPLEKISEIRQKKANVTRLLLTDGDSITVNSKNGLRLFKFLNDVTDEDL